mgnify:CR=1 FL=1
MAVLPIICGKDLVSILEQDRFEVVRIKGSHFRMKHPDGRVTTVPVHKNEDLPKGLLRKIIREDVQCSIEAFIALTRRKY